MTHVRISMTGHGRGEVFIDGEKVDRVRSIRFDADAHDMANELTLTILPETVEIDGPSSVHRGNRMKGYELLGYTLSDQITGFVGVATGYVQYISGCNQILLVPRVTDDGAWREPQWFDEQRLLLLPNMIRIVLDSTGPIGFDKQAPVR